MLQGQVPHSLGIIDTAIVWCLSEALIEMTDANVQRLSL